MLKKTLIILLYLSCIVPASAFAAVQATGTAMIFNNNEGLAKKQALNNAQRAAVEQGVGLILDSQTITKNWQLIKDEIYTSSRGFVTGYEILSEGKTSDGKSWTVTIKAEVGTADIESKLKELRILHQKMGNKKFAVIYTPGNSKSLKLDHTAVQATITQVEKMYIGKGFRLFAISHSPDQTSETLRKEAKNKGIEMLVEFEISPGRSDIGRTGKFTAVRPEINMLVWDIQTGRKISSVYKTSKKITNARFGSYAWDSALSQAASKAAREASQESIGNIVKFYEEVGDIGNSFHITIINYSEEEEDSILRILENLEGFQSLNEKENAPGLLVIDYFSTTGKSRLRRLLKEQARRDRITLQYKIISGNRLIVQKPGTED